MSPKRTVHKSAELSRTLEEISSSTDLYIVFIDLCDSTLFKQYCLDQNIPDSTWIMRQRIFLQRTAEIIYKYKGTIIKTIGDEVMATFDKVSRLDTIFKCCVDVFQIFEGLKAYNKGRFKIASKASLDFGTCYNGQILSADIFDPIGTCVDRCARIAKHAEPNQLVFSSSVLKNCREKRIDLSVYNIEKEHEVLNGIGPTDFYRTKIVY